MDTRSTGTPEPEIVTDIVAALDRFCGGTLRDGRILALLLGCVHRSGTPARLGPIAFQASAAARLDTLLRRQAAGGDERAVLERAYAEALGAFHRELTDAAAAFHADDRAALASAVLAPQPAAFTALQGLAADLAHLKDWERAEHASGTAAHGDPDGGTEA